MSKKAPAPSDDELLLLSLMAKGLTDDRAASELGWTRRTLSRRLAGAMKKLGATSRFQAGVLAERQSWLQLGESSPSLAHFRHRHGKDRK